MLSWAVFAIRSGGGTTTSDGTSPASGGACTLPTASVVSYQDLQCHPEAHLFYPGAKVYERLGASQSTTIDGELNPAFSRAILISSAPVSQIYAWYDSWLTAHGWYRGPVIRVTTYLSSHGYARSRPGDYGREAFIVNIDNPALLSTTLGHQVPSGGTIFEVRYVVFPYTPGYDRPAPSCPATPEASGPVSTFYCNP